MLDVVTVTGADDNTRPEELASLAQKFPFVEFGILVGNHPGTPRYPSATWRDDLSDVAVRNRSLHLSAHLCGRWVESFLTGDVWIADWFDRYQYEIPVLCKLNAQQQEQELPRFPPRSPVEKLEAMLQRYI